MTRLAKIVSLLVPTLVLVIAMGFWISGILYFRLPNAKITLNGQDLSDGKIYTAGNGDYILFLESENARFPVYSVINDGRNVGTPASPIPSTFTKSIKTDFLVLCLQCPITIAGSDKFDLNASVATSTEEIVFRVSSDSVIVKF